MLAGVAEEIPALFGCTESFFKGNALPIQETPHRSAAA